MWIGWPCFSFGQAGNTYNIVTNPSLPFDWNEKYIDVYDLDMVRLNTLKEKPGKSLIFSGQKSPKCDKDRYLFEFIKKHTDTSHFLALHTAKSEGYDTGVGIYRTDVNFPFSEQDKHVLDLISPIIVSMTRAIMQYADFDLKRIAAEKVRESLNALSITLNYKLEPIDLPEEAIAFFKKHFSTSAANPIPEPINKWIRQTIAPTGILRHTHEPWIYKHPLPDMDLYCKACTIVSSLIQPALLILFYPHGGRIDFSPLKKDGLTQREIEAISYLPLSYTNKQIAMAMDIEEVTAKKHLKTAAEKMETVGRVGVLYEAMKKIRLGAFYG